MRRRDKASGEAVKTRRYKTKKRRNASKHAPHRSSLGARKETNVARLTRERDEALEQRTATAEVLKLISRSTFDLQTVLDATVASAVRLCEAERGLVFRREGEIYKSVAYYNYPREFREFHESHPITPDRGTAVGRTALEGKTVQIVDILADPEYTFTEAQKLGQGRATLAVPLLREATPIGALALQRTEPRPYSPKQIELVETFAAQAVIAIENTRLLNELHQRTDDLTESLEQQTASGEILASISGSMTDTKPVFDAIVRNLLRLFGARWACVQVVHDGIVHMPAIDGDAGSKKLIDYYPRPLDETTMGGRAMLNKQILQFSEIENNPAVPFTTQQFAREFGFRSAIFAPMIRDNRVIGAIGVANFKPRVFSDKQVALIKAFAAQAVIAIENTRLLNELRQRTYDLSESLEQQTATSEVLRVISSSPTNVQPVFDAIAESAVRLCDGQFSFVLRFDGKVMDFASCCGLSAEGLDAFHSILPMPASEDTASGRAVVRRAVVEIPDVEADPSYGAQGQGLAKAVTYRSIAAVPLLHEGNPIGTIAVARADAGSFPKRQIVLLQAFADQAVIAIENVRLFDEVQARTRDLTASLQQQTATADVLKAISRSTFDLKTVLDALVEAAARLCEADQGTIAREWDGVYQRVATYGFSEDFKDYVRTLPIMPDRGTAVGRSLLEGKVVHIPDVRVDPEYTFVEGQKLGDYRTVLSVPMLREGTPIGVLALTRHDMRPFNDKQIELVTTFADQAAIAIENVRLFESVEARTRELAKSLEDLRTAQDRLVQTEKLASLGQLTAGIAHEIKNPLNFVNNFSAVSVELIDELRQALARANLDNKLRAEISEIADTLQGNLDKVVQHGKRADAIVKNMLLHSREGSGEHRPVDINAIVEESLNLAYHGARAEKQGFNITLERSFDPTAGEADVFPQDITRVLLNLISNGFYAATKRKAQADNDAYEPILGASTRSLGDRVEIRIRDNGTGIPPEVKEKIFNPFFTTKPAGEGTGLGLSITHDIVVKQHFGSIEVDTQPGEFTEIRIILPRAAVFVAESGGRA